MTDTPDTHVWVRDRIGRGYPRPREVALANKGEWRIDYKHPVRDWRGRLLPTKFPASYPEPVTSEADTATEATEEATP